MKTEQEKLIEEYVNSLNELDTKALEISKQHLQSSFDITKSVGYIKWIKSKKINA
tara:strand:- start:10661 stop:10825 length:165 start_codon:yes stop_codon:yes gene_type:complete